MQYADNTLQQWLPNYGCGCVGNQFLIHESLPANAKIAVRASDQPLFRYLAPKYADDLLHHGKLRISPLCAYRDPAIVGVSRHDEREGLVPHNPGGVNNAVTWCSTDAYCLCLSRFGLRELAVRFGRPDEPARCVQLPNIVTFSEILDAAVRARLGLDGRSVLASVANEVAYCDFPGFEFDGYGCAVHPAFVKPHIDTTTKKHYWIEGEYRLIWDMGTRGGMLPHIDVSCPEIRTLVEDTAEVKLCGDEVIRDLRVRAYTQRDHEKWVASQESSLPTPGT